MKTVEYSDIARATNNVQLRGNLTRDPEIVKMPKGGQLVKLGLAINEEYEDKVTHEKKTTTTFVDVDVWGQAAEGGDKLKKGSPVVVAGLLKEDTWEDKETKKKHSRLKVTATDLAEVQFKPDQALSGYKTVMSFEDIKEQKINSNRVTLKGNLTAEPEFRVTPKGTPVLSFRVGNNRTYKTADGVEKTETSFVNVDMMGKKAEDMRDLAKGDSVFIEGSLDYSAWEDKTTGEKRNALKIKAFDVAKIAASTKNGGEEAADLPSETSANKSSSKVPF
jgi:single-strand DNA-binding protein